MKPIGRFAITRSLVFDHWLAENDEYLLAWIKMIATVNFTDNETMHGMCKRGSSFKSLDQWATILKWNKSKVRRFFTLLKKHHMIEQKKAHNTTHLSICNYDTYQFGRHTNEHTIDTRMDTRSTPIEERTIKIKKDITERKKDFIKDAEEEWNSKGGLSFMTKQGLSEFVNYWIESGKGDKKFRREKQSSFSMGGRLSTWLKNDYNNVAKPKTQEDKETERRLRMG